MQKSKIWYEQAKQLCGALGSEDGIDPRILARKSETKPKNYKNLQLCKEVKQISSLVLIGELEDEVLQNLEVVDVTINTDGKLLLIWVRSIDVGFALDEGLILNRLQAVQGYLRAVIAQSVRRKRVPNITFKLLPLLNKR